MARRPLAAAAANLAHKAIEQLFAVGSMVHFGMELHSVEAAGDILDGADRGVFGARHHLETGRNLGNMVAVTHPYRALALDEKLFEQRSRPTHGMQLGMAVFALAGGHHLATEMAGQQLHAVADAEHRHPEVEQGLGHRGSALVIDRLGPAGKDDAARCEGPDRLQLHIEGMQFAIDMGFAHPPGNELGILGTEIEDQYLFAVNILGHGISKKRFGAGAPRDPLVSSDCTQS